MAIIAFDSVSKAYQEKTVLHDFSLFVESGQRVVILGPSGCGKTTVLRLLAGFTAPDIGTISIDGHVVAAAGKILQWPEERHLGMVFQDLALWPHLTVEGNLEFGLKAQGLPRSQRVQRITAMLRMVEMDAYRRARPAASSRSKVRLACKKGSYVAPKIVCDSWPYRVIN